MATLDELSCIAAKDDLGEIVGRAPGHSREKGRRETGLSFG
jgi:hypothetical protein